MPGAQRKNDKEPQVRTLYWQKFSCLQTIEAKPKLDEVRKRKLTHQLSHPKALSRDQMTTQANFLLLSGLCFLLQYVLPL